MHIVISVWAVLAAWRWGDWKQFNQFHATMLYMPFMNLFYLAMTGKYPLWRLQPEFGLPYIPTVALYTFIIFPCTVFVYLSRYPKPLKKQLLHILKWILIYIGVEWIGYRLGHITYGNGWSLRWSLFFVITMFPMLRLHYKKPVLAYLFSVFVIISLIYMFDVPWTEFPVTP